MTNINVEEQIDLAMADLTVGTVDAGGGKMRPEQSNTFYQKLIESSPLLGDIRTIQMTADTMNINKISLANQILHPANAGTPPYPADDSTNSRYLLAANRFAPAFDKVVLTVKEYQSEITLTDDVVENNVEGANLTDVILNMAAKRISRDIQNLIINGDTANVNDLLASANGVLKLVTSNVVAAGGAWSPTIAANAVKALPEAYWDLLDEYNFYLHRNVVVNQKVAIAARQTILGDQVIVNGNELSVLGYAVKSTGTMPLANGLFMNPKQVLLGIQRDIRVETERSARARATTFVITTKLGVQHEQEDAAVKISGITG